jgi:exo-beta-1,3-glucanase (GH17 family)
MITNGERNKLIWVTESGAPTNGDPAFPGNFTTESNQALIVQKGFTEAIKLGYVGPVFTYMHRDKGVPPGSSTNNEQMFFGVKNNARADKPAAVQFRNAKYTF